MLTLVIDDSRAIRAILRKYLAALGHQALEAGNGVEALSVLKANAGVSLALVDWNMPEMNGIDFVKAVRADQAFAKLRMIMVTTETEMSNVATALEAGADEYIMKPFTQEMIQEKIALVATLPDHSLIGS